MGKGKKTKREKALKCDPTSNLNIPAIIYKLPEDRTKPPQQPKLIPPNTFETISESMLQTVPPHRNVFLSMCEYRIRDINPTHKETNESPTHMIIFCLRIVVSDQFYPIGVVQIDKRLNQTDKLVHVWKTYLQDLSLLRLIVIGSVSPPSRTFHRILKELTKIPNMKDYTGPITYSVWPYKDIVHLYDYNYLLHETQEALYERNEMCFMACSSSEKNPGPLQLWTASWTDILLVLTSQGINCYYISEDHNATPLAIFFADFWKTYQQAGIDGVMDTDSKESTDRLMELLCPFATLLQDHKSFMCPYDLQNFYDNNEELRILLATAKYKKLRIPVAGGILPEVSKVLTEEMLNNYSTSISTASLKDTTLLTDNSSTKTSSSIEICENHMNNIFTIIDSSLNNVSPFDIFLQKVTYDDYDLFVKTSPQLLIARHQTKETRTPKEKDTDSVFHDHDYFRKRSPEKSPPDKPHNSTIYNIVKDYFGEASELCKKSLENLKIKSAPPSVKQHFSLSEKSETGHVIENSPSIHHSNVTIDLSKVFQLLLDKNETKNTQPNINAVNACDNTNNCSDQLPDISLTCEKSTGREKDDATKNCKTLKMKKFKGDQSLRTPKDRGNKKVKAKRLRNKENVQKLIASLPYIFSDNSPERDDSLLSRYYPDHEDILNGKNVTDCNALNLNNNVDTKGNIARLPKNKKTDNSKTYNDVQVRKMENDSLLKNNDFPGIKGRKNENCKRTGDNLLSDLISNDLLKTVKLSSIDPISIKGSKHTKIEEHLKNVLNDDDLNTKVQQYSKNIQIAKYNYNEIDVVQVSAKNGHKPSKGPVESVLYKPSASNIKNTLRIKNREKPQPNICDKNIDEVSLNHSIQEDGLLNNLTQSILNSAIQDFSSIFASYKKALEVSKNGRSERSEDSKHYNHLENQSDCKNEVLSFINGFNTQSRKQDEKENDIDTQISDSDSIDSLTELLTSIETDHGPAKIPCKYTIPKTHNVLVKRRLDKHSQEYFMPHTSSYFRNIDRPPQDLFYQRRSLEINQTSLEELGVNQTLNMLDKTLENYSQEFVTNMLEEDKPRALKNEYTINQSQTIQTDGNTSPPLSNPDSLEESTSGEVLTDFVANTALHENINRMFAATSSCLKDLDKDAKQPNWNKSSNTVLLLDDKDSIPQLEGGFLPGVKSSYSSGFLDSKLGTESIPKVDLHRKDLTDSKMSLKVDRNLTGGAFTEDTPISNNSCATIPNNESFKIKNIAQEQTHFTAKKVMLCCNVASTSCHNHSPSSEIETKTGLPHYTRFRKSFSGSTPSSALVVGPIGSKETIPPEENVNNCTIAEDFNATLPLPPISMREGNDCVSDYEEAYKPEEPNGYVECTNTKRSFSNGTTHSACGVSPVYLKEASFQRKNTNSSKFTEKPNVTINNISMDTSTIVHDTVLNKQNNVESIDLTGYYKSLKHTVSISKLNKFSSEDEEYQPDEPNDYTEYKGNRSVDNDVENKNTYKQGESYDYVEYKEYKRSLEACDNQESKCDIIYKDKKTYERLCSQIPDDFETLRVTTDWLCTFKGYIKLKEVLVARKVRQFQASALSVEHIDFFVHLIRKGRNNTPSVYQGQSYKPLDYRGVFDLLSLGKGVYMIRNDTDVNNMSL